MKKYKFEFSYKIIATHGEEYAPPVVANVQVNTLVPEGTNPMTALAARISQELKNTQATVEFEWEPEDKDPIESIEEF